MTDGFGKGRVVMNSFVRHERVGDVVGVLEDFRQLMGDVSGVKAITMDCSKAEIAASKMVFPTVPIFLCYFHFRQAVMRKVSRNFCYNISVRLGTGTSYGI